MSFHVPNQYRFRDKAHLYGSDDSFGNAGAFIIPFGGYDFWVIASDGAMCKEAENWEHVSISLKSRCPNWKEMCFMKNLFWDKEDCVIQYHPPESKYVNNHPNVLHLWRPKHEKIPMPPLVLI